MTYICYKKGGGVAKKEVAFSSFPDGDIHCVVHDIADLVQKPVLIVHDLYPDQNQKIIQLCWLLDVLTTNGVGPVSLFIPYLPYARQDKSHVAGETISATALCRLLHALGCARLYTVDCHFMKGASEEVRGGLPIVNFSAANYLIAACRQAIGHDQFEVVGPDKGSGYLAKDFGSKHMHKVRGEYGSEPSATRYRDIVDMQSSHIDLQHTTVVIIDDMVSTGSTIIKAINLLREQGMEHILVATTHGLFLNESLTRLKDLADGVIASDTITNDHSISTIEPILRDTLMPHWHQSHTHATKKPRVPSR